MRKKTTNRIVRSARGEGAFRYYHNLAIEGGGVLGLAYLGALKEIFEDGSMEAFDCFAGSSAGSLITLLLACGADYKFIRDTIWNFDLSKLKDRSWFGGDIIRFVRRFGLYKGDQLTKFIEDTMLKLTGKKHPTFMQIFNQTGKRLVITGANLNKLKVEYFTLETHPNMSATVAARISCSIPFFFRPVKYQGDYYVDGGVLDNYPVHYFDNNTQYINTKTLGLKLISNEDKRIEAGITKPIHNLKDFSGSLISCLHTQAQKVHVKQEDWQRTVRIHTEDLSFIDFDMPEKDKLLLVEAGRTAILKYMTRRKSVVSIASGLKLA